MTTSDNETGDRVTPPAPEAASLFGKSRAGGAIAGGAIDYYAVLDVAPTATRIEVREAYLRLKNTYGGDGAALYSLIDESEAKAQLVLVEEAYRVLYDDVLRREHDLKLGIVRTPAKAEASAVFGFSAGHDNLDMGVERLLLAREREAAQAMAQAQATRAASREAAVSAPVSVTGGAQRAGTTEGGGDPGLDSGVVRTQRSTLPIIALHGESTGTDELRRQMQAMIDESDAGDGDLYRRLRLLAKVSEDELQERTKVSIGYIRAIEANRFDRLPQAVYVKGFLRSFFRYIAAPEPDKLVAAFAQRLTEWQTANRKG